MNMQKSLYKNNSNRYRIHILPIPLIGVAALIYIVIYCCKIS